MTIASDIDRVPGATLRDSAGEKVGTIGQVFFDDQTNEPRWVTVSTGLFGSSESFVPLHGARFDGDALHVAHTKEQIKDAPRVEVDQHLSQAEEAELYRYYGLQWAADVPATPGPAAPATGPHAIGDASGDAAAMTVSEERLEVGTEIHEAGRARLRKYTTTETETVTVPVTKERLVVERNPVVGDRAAAPITETDTVEEVTLREERAIVDKEVVPVEEVRIGKEQVTVEEEVVAEVRKERVEVEGATELGTTDDRRR